MSLKKIFTIAIDGPVGAGKSTVADAVAHLKRDQWWAQVHEELETMTSAELADYHADAETLDVTTADGLRER